MLIYYNKFMNVFFTIDYSQHTRNILRVQGGQTVLLADRARPSLLCDSTHGSVYLVLLGGPVNLHFKVHIILYHLPIRGPGSWLKMRTRRHLLVVAFE